MGAKYTGRFAPSPTGPLHAGSLVAALASWLDARTHQGRWLLRIEDIDTPRCLPGADQTIIAQLAACGMEPDEAPLWQSARSPIYRQTLDTLIQRGLAYPCGCTRQDIVRALTASGQVQTRHTELVYPGTCRHGLQGRPARAWRLLTDKNQSNQALAQSAQPYLAINSIASINQLTTSVSEPSTPDEVIWHDRWLGQQQQNVAQEVGDFVLRRADGFWAYQLAVVVDDAAQGISHVVRGADLADNTARQILLQQALGLPQPVYMHTPLVLAADGEKLSKQHGAPALDLSSPVKAVQALHQAGLELQLQLPVQSRHSHAKDWLDAAIPQWQAQRIARGPLVKP